jgi:hypothetical protein
MMANPYYPELYDRDWLIQAYVTERKSQNEIAAEIGCSSPPLRRALKRFDIARRSATEQRDLSLEGVQAWRAKGGCALNRPFGPTEHKAAAEELGVSSVDDLIVLSSHHDPFYCGMPSQVANAEWFKEQWEKHGSLGHLRRLHYRLVSGEERVTFIDDRAYGNNKYSFVRLCGIGGDARALGLVGAEEFDDRRNPDPVINVKPRMYPSEPGVEIEEFERPWRVALPSMPGDYFLNVGTFEIPDPVVSGYDYLRADQPVVLELWIEKSTANDILDPVCIELGVNFVPGSGTQSITSAHKLLQRLREHGKPGHVFYVSDCDDQGGNMPRSVARHLEFYRQRDFPDVEVSLEPIALTRQQVEDLGLPSVDGTEDGPVELDALEALHPGLLAKMVREAVARYRDDALAQDLADAEEEARSDAGDAWDEATADLRSELDQLAADAKVAAEPFRARLAALAAEFDQAIAPTRKRAEELEGELQGLANAFDPELPERPESEPPDVDEAVLFDSRRDWLDQLERYKEDR